MKEWINYIRQIQSRWVHHIQRPDHNTQTAPSAGRTLYHHEYFRQRSS